MYGHTHLHQLSVPLAHRAPSDPQSQSLQERATDVVVAVLGGDLRVLSHIFHRITGLLFKFITH